MIPLIRAQHREAESPIDYYLPLQQEMKHFRENSQRACPISVVGTLTQYSEIQIAFGEEKFKH